ncbi:hypothetical protein EYF80_029189 [Liparis tanakae]|uniref:Uncharacterized protein n=1 Tax=Liparis tanakae TaxID=230148 RepID=A0A4Z2H412_9TELE|nr:hypothetical protein EYF80_029189 [Liparis tanakae]
MAESSSQSMPTGEHLAFLGQEHRVELAQHHLKGERKALRWTAVQPDSLSFPIRLAFLLSSSHSRSVFFPSEDARCSAVRPKASLKVVALWQCEVKKARSRPSEPPVNAATTSSACCCERHFGVQSGSAGVILTASDPSFLFVSQSPSLRQPTHRDRK